ncbi:MAG: MerR family transcriptional regulator [Candidatus Omnitrophica bacterium]|nr:MerR family transcriptional regulator [Candidatus Omnitrophota bacterium]
MLNAEGKKRLTITEVAEIIGISAKTIMRWEKNGRIKKPKRDWRGWRVYDQQDVEVIRSFHDAVFEAE